MIRIIGKEKTVEIPEELARQSKTFADSIDDLKTKEIHVEDRDPDDIVRIAKWSKGPTVVEKSVRILDFEKQPEPLKIEPEKSIEYLLISHWANIQTMCNTFCALTARAVDRLEVEKIIKLLQLKDFVNEDGTKKDDYDEIIAYNRKKLKELRLSDEFIVKETK